ncbi:MAG TPA: DUF4412 domain-containing protein [Myxococcota bacterium]|nr:DUF4412 domain-containing protein [Myxococcota bacterium]
MSYVRLSIALFVFLAAAGAAVAAAAEQGDYIEQSVIIEADGGQPPMKGVQKIWFTPDRLRSETTYGDKTSVTIIDLRRERIILMPSAEKQYIEMKLADYQRLVAMRLAHTDLGKGPAPRLEKTEEQKKIAGFSCTKFIFEQSGKMPVHGELWVSAEPGIDFVTFLGLMKKMGMQVMLGRLSDLVDSLEGYPVELKIEQGLPGQKVTTTQRLIKAARGPVDPKLFTVPAGYRPIEDEKLPGAEKKKGDK